MFDCLSNTGYGIIWSFDFKDGNIKWNCNIDELRIDCVEGIVLITCHEHVTYYVMC